MTPADVAALTAVAALVRDIGSWPIVSVIAAFVLGPWVAMLYLARSAEKRHAAALRMYEDNVVLVKDYAEACRRWGKISEALLGVVSLNTQSQATLKETIRHNEFCPISRKEGPNRG